MPGPAHLLPWLAFVALLAISGADASAACGQGPGTKDQGQSEDDRYLAGLVGTYRDAAGATATRIDHQLSFHWADAAADARLTKGEFQATWRGLLNVEGAGAYRFQVFGTGEVELKVGGQAVIAQRRLSHEWHAAAPVTLAAELLAIELIFRRTDPHARLMVLWSGPGFGTEPLPGRLLYHDRGQTVPADFERGRQLVRVLRCGRCHAGEDVPPPAPALDRLAGNVSRGWLASWLADPAHGAAPTAPRRMPALGLTADQAASVADWLLQPREPVLFRVAPPKPERAAPKARRTPAKPKPDAAAGERLFLTLGCLACHTWRDLGASGWPGGGDLTRVGDKRPADYFAAWLADPARLNRDHRMPVFPLSDDERTALALFLAAQKGEGDKPLAAMRPADGRQLVNQFQCGTCHRLPDDSPRAPTAPRLHGDSRWERSCLGAADPATHRPGYQLSAADAKSVRAYYAGRRPLDRPKPPDGPALLADHNCLACHQREGDREATPLLPPLLTDKLAAVAARVPDLAPLLPELTPPALNSVGDKLTDAALADAIARHGASHRPYLQVRMPRFPLQDDDLKALVRHLSDADRVPPQGNALAPADTARQGLAGGRLVSGDGFGCTSCHQVGRVLPPPGPPGARGPDLAQLGGRIRKSWFDRWVRNPARIVPRMEMPSVQIPVGGVLGEKLDAQLDAVWQVLNQPGFEPPPPNPVRTLRHTGTDAAASPLLVTDVLRRPGVPLVKPFLVGLANRHNVLFDLEAARLAVWTVGDTARERTEGKTWFWELAGAPVLDPALPAADVALLVGEREESPRRAGQFVTEADAWETRGSALALEYRLHVGSVVLHVRRAVTPLPAGFAQELSVSGVPAGAQVRLHVLSVPGKVAADRRTLDVGDRFASRIAIHEPADVTFTGDRSAVLLTPDRDGTARAVLHYLSDVPVDQFPPISVPPAPARVPESVDVAPGFVAQRLPLPTAMMPTGLAWRPDGRLVLSSLQGQVFEAADTDRDGCEDQLRLLEDGLPAPYGIHAGADYVDVAAKYAVLRIRDAGSQGRRVEAVASGWGYTADYHDWAVGLPRNARGEYFLGIPCQQDERSPEAARFRGTVLRLVPREPTRDDPRRYRPEPVSFGHRFPMGLTLDRRGALFVTDNQGNYNPFNELNHVRPGAHYGFINALDRGKPVPPLTPPAIDIPHPWTRSVNGVCVLDLPDAAAARAAFGPLAGHLVGCEYDTRRLVRLSLQQVGDTVQGAAYPLSIPTDDPKRGLLGPVACAVSPRGELYVGGLRDSGWGAGNNVGEVVRIQVRPAELPCGIAEVRAVRDGFEVAFCQPVERDAAGRPESYVVQSYRRESTPAYGGPDRDRRTETVAGVTVASDARTVTLRLAEMRAGFVYELRLKNLAPGGGTFYPAEAHYTLRVLPR